MLNLFIYGKKGYRVDIYCNLCVKLFDYLFIRIYAKTTLKRNQKERRDLIWNFDLIFELVHRKIVFVSHKNM